MPTIPKGSSVLVTGVNGYLASHIVDQLLLAGYRVHGTVRSLSDAILIKQYTDSRYGYDALTLYEVPDPVIPGAFGHAIIGVSGIIFVCSSPGTEFNARSVTSSVIGSTTNLLEAARAERNISRFVFTSSLTAAVPPGWEVPSPIDRNTWNMSFVERVWGSLTYQLQSPQDVLTASKIAAEQALWRFVSQNRVHFECNSILPDVIFGPPIMAERRDITLTDMMMGMSEDGPESVDRIYPHYFIDVRDCARLHVVALLDSRINRERIPAVTDLWSWQRVQMIAGEVGPYYSFLNAMSTVGEDQRRLPSTSRVRELVRRAFGRSRWIGLEESIQDTADRVPVSR